jgi:hypothetical protein
MTSFSSRLSSGSAAAWEFCLCVVVWLGGGGGGVWCGGFFGVLFINMLL